MADWRLLSRFVEPHFYELNYKSRAAVKFCTSVNHYNEVIYCTASAIELRNGVSSNNKCATYRVFITRDRGVVMSSVSSLCACVCLSVCLSVCNALTFDRLNLESAFLVCRYIFGIAMSVSYIKVVGSRSRSQEQNSISVLFGSKFQMP